MIRVIAMTVAVLTAYAAISFVVWDFNIYDWGEAGRLMFVFLGIIFSVVALAGTSEEEESPNE